MSRNRAEFYWDTIKLISDEYCRDPLPWVVAYSGGKDSSAVLKLVTTAISLLPNPTKTIHVVYCDTGVEIPVVAQMVDSVLEDMARELLNSRLPIRVTRAMPRLYDRFFVKVIGRGFPPPTHRFRWCTDRLRIDPIARLLCQIAPGPRTILLGLRRSESAERARLLSRHNASSRYRFLQIGHPKSSIFSPIVDYSIEDVWETLIEVPLPKSIDVVKLAQIYRDASGDCPFIREFKGAPCGKGRFGCWTCTVVRQDYAVKSMIREGHIQLGPLFNFRNWLGSYRDTPDSRCSRRRNGALGPGPFTLHARGVIFDNLLKSEREAGIRLLSVEEEKIINSMWGEDLCSCEYRDKTGDRSIIKMPVN